MKNLSFNKTVLPLFAVAVLFCAITFTSCKKETDCTAVIYVVDTLGAPVPAAAIRVYSELGTLQEQTLTADSRGSATFVFKYQAILDIEATHPNHIDTARGIIKLEPGETVNQTVDFQQ
jgi:hypothetical protein